MFKIHKNLLSIKCHYLLLYMVMAPLLIFLPLMARQVGFSGTMVGVMYMTLPLVGMIAKPTFGGIADKFQCKKFLLYSFLVIIVISVFLISFIPTIPTESKVHFSCNNTQLVFDTTPNNRTIDDKCAVMRIIKENKDKSFLACSMKCLMPGPKLYDTDSVVFEFITHVQLHQIDVVEHTMYFPVSNVTLPDDNVVIPFCANVTYRVSLICDANCESSTVTSLLSKTQIPDKDIIRTYQFWMFFLLAVISWIGWEVVNNLTDTVCYDMLNNQPFLYGYQKLFGGVGGTMSVVPLGILIDVHTGADNSKANYKPIFISMFILMLFEFLILSRLKYSYKKKSKSIIRDVSKILFEARMIMFLTWCFLVGIFTAVIWQFFLWHVEDVAAKYEGAGNDCNTYRWLKTLESITFGLRCFLGEIPLCLLSGWILKRIGHAHCMSLVLLAFSVQYYLYSALADPTLILLTCVLYGATYGLQAATITSYARITAPPGTEAFTQGIAGATFKDFGTSAGSLIGGIIFDYYGGRMTFRIYFIASFICCILHAFIQKFILKKSDIFLDYNGESNMNAISEETVRITAEEEQ